MSLDICDRLWDALLEVHPVSDHRGIVLTGSDARRWCEQQLSVHITSLASGGAHLGACTILRSEPSQAGSWNGWSLLRSSVACSCWGGTLTGLHRAAAGAPQLLAAAQAAAASGSLDDRASQGAAAHALTLVQEWREGVEHAGREDVEEAAATLRARLERAIGYTGEEGEDRSLLAQPSIRGSNSTGRIIQALSTPLDQTGVLRSAPRELAALLGGLGASVSWPVEVVQIAAFPTAAELAVATTLVGEGSSLEAAVELARGAVALCP